MANKKIDDLLLPGDSLRHMTINGGRENGGVDIECQRCDEGDGNGWLYHQGTRKKVKWTFRGG